MKILNGFDGLWHQGNEALTTNANIRVVIIGTINGKVIRPRPLSIDRKLSGCADAEADTGTAYTGSKGRRRDTGKEKRIFIKRALRGGAADRQQIEFTGRDGAATQR